VEQSKSRNPYSVSSVKNCGTLSLYKIPRSQFWYFRYWSRARDGYVKVSTRTADKNEALHIAKVAWQQSGIPFAERIAPELTFRHWADEFLVSQARAVERQELSPIVQRMDISRLNNGAKFFAAMPIREIGSAQVDAYRDHLHTSKSGIAPATVRHYLLATRKVLTFAARQGVINSVPLMPKHKAGDLDSPRCKFNLTDYRKLTSYLAREGKQNPRLAELRDCVIFLTNTLLRPSEFKDLRLSDCVEKIGNDGRPCLWVNPQHPKVRSRKYETPSMGGALFAFNRMRKRLSDGERYLFFPSLEDRSGAIQKLGGLFRKSVKILNLYTSPDGVRTLYSLRHTGITWRMEAGTATVFEIARWARTSVGMIEKHYARQFDFKNRTEALLAKRPRPDRTKSRADEDEASNQ
jgi:hypothetical protein